MDHSGFERRTGYRDARIEYLEWERDRLLHRLHETQERFHQFMRESRTFASRMRGRLSERRRLDLQYSVLRSLEKITDPDDIPGMVLEILGRGLGKSLGIYWTVEGEKLYCGGFWHPFGEESAAPALTERACRDSAPLRGEGLAGRTWAEGGTVWVEDLKTEGTDTLSKIAAEEGFLNLVAFPVGNSGGMLHVMGLFGRKPEAADEGLIRTLTILGNQVAQVIERKRAEEAMRASDERYSTLLAKGTDMITISDRDGNIIYASPSTERVSGYTADELRGSNPFANSIHPEDLDLCREAMERLIATPGLTLTLQHRARHKSGGWRWFEGTFTSLFHDPSVGGLLANVRDITERRQAEDALRESEEWLGLAQRAARSGTWEWDFQSGELRWSEEHRALFGFDAEGPITRERWWAAVYPEDVGRLEEAGRLCCEEEAEWPVIEYRITRANDGERRWISARGRTVKNAEGRPVRILGISVDVTEHRRAERERVRLRALEAVAHAQAAERERISRDLHDRVAHDMAVVHQSLQLFSAIDASESSRESARLQRAMEVARSALDATRHLSSELRRPAAEESLEDALREFVDTYVPEEIETVFLFDGDESSVPDKIRGQTYLILREAVRNALKHSGCHSLKVGVEVVPGAVRGSVGDDGCGFEPEGDRDSVGLKSMRERTALLGGDLRVVSGNGEGTRVEVYVPLARSGEEG